jgi:hypothetical protein
MNLEKATEKARAATEIRFEGGCIRAYSNGWCLETEGKTARYFGTISGAVSCVLEDRMRFSGRKSLQDLLGYMQDLKRDIHSIFEEPKTETVELVVSSLLD